MQGEQEEPYGLEAINYSKEVLQHDVSCFSSLSLNYQSNSFQNCNKF